MALTATQIITIRAPQFAADTRINDMITLAAQMTSPSAFGTNYQLALALRVMHWLALEVRNGGSTGNSGSGTGGALTSEREGQLGRSYSVSSQWADKYSDLTGTQYGLELIGLIRGTILGPRNRTITEER